jgi:DNA-binding transcriptional regulator YiaG
MTPLEVKALRRRLGWTQRQVAAALNVTVTSVARWEQGARTVSPLAATSLTLLAKQHGVAPRRPSRKAS